TGHHQIQDQDVERLRMRALDRMRPQRDADDLVAAGADQGLDHVPDRVLVFADEDTHGRAHSTRRAASSPEIVGERGPPQARAPPRSSETPAGKRSTTAARSSANRSALARGSPTSSMPTAPFKLPTGSWSPARS